MHLVVSFFLLFGANLGIAIICQSLICFCSQHLISCPLAHPTAHSPRSVHIWVWVSCGFFFSLSILLGGLAAFLSFFADVPLRIPLHLGCRRRSSSTTCSHIFLSIVLCTGVSDARVDWLTFSTIAVPLWTSSFYYLSVSCLLWRDARNIILARTLTGLPFSVSLFLFSFADSIHGASCM